MQFTTILTFAAVAISTTLGVVAQDATTLWVPMATVTEVQTFTGTRVEEVWTDVAPYERLTTFPITWTATETQTQFRSIITTMPAAERLHARDFQ